MKCKIPVLLILCTLSWVVAWGQTSSTTSKASSTESSGDNEVSGRGTPGFVPLFVGPTRIGNSGIFQSLQGTIGVGLTNPTDLFEVHSDSAVVPVGRYGPAAIFTEATGNVTGTAGIRAWAGSFSGSTFGVVPILVWMATMSSNGSAGRSSLLAPQGFRLALDQGK
jgi:hypothetical protein